MSFSNIYEAIDRFKEEVDGALASGVEAATDGYIPLLLQRVQFEQKNSKGDRLGNYSQSYSNYKKKQGKQSQFVDLTDTFEMLGSIGLQRLEKSQGKVEFVIAPDDSKRGQITNKELMAINEERYGDVMTPNDFEQEVITATFVDVVSKLVGRIF